ncbi:rab3 GTPase-activating protein catalytic subunit isoform X2 [Amborella trichopoda]|uniref:rab3 GTPase-activating protein catalytic subunit isoform X2 n=1 Tax=Amborella trichopoda TaxID=13333 RepID=UPI0009C079F4|nr:rab3 GTPase-activating protein catalytic subunit isoform X2 [Amborella trichopoda]|eukprot:XP_020524661.1 rab3 GTPase-activating protein catalytic subunit isoform X2 [Amborella trichopoda]
MGKGAELVLAPKNLYKVKCDVKYGMKSYCMEYYFELETHGKSDWWKDEVHNLQLSFGITEFLVITPLSMSGVILDAPEATKLLGAVAIALSNCGSAWPAFVPVHDPTRNAYNGIENIGMCFSRRFETDRIGSQVPIRLMHLEGLYELFVSKFAFVTTDLTFNFFKVHFTMRLTYRTPPNDGDEEHGDESETVKSSVDMEGPMHIIKQWDDDCPWAEWYSAEDPVKGFELVTIWSTRIVESSLEMAEFENASTKEADKWFLMPIVFSSVNDGAKTNQVGFASQLSLLLSAFRVSFEAEFMEDFTSVENHGSDNLKSSTTIPPPTVLDRVLKELFPSEAQVSGHGEREHKHSKSIKGAPLGSLFAQFCLYSLWFGNCNIRAISALWVEFVREVRWCWEESKPLPKMPVTGTIDLSSCLIHQKLQMLALCIVKRDSQNQFFDCDEDETSIQNENIKECLDEGDLVQKPMPLKMIDGGCKSGTRWDGDTSQDLPLSPRVRRGSAGVVANMMLLKSYQKMHAPITQDPPVMTEDMHEERLQTMEAFGDAFCKGSSVQLEKEILSSDMAAFKAANPGAVFEDFIRWHSPGHWETAENGETDILKKNSTFKRGWPPKGRLSHRMSEYGNLWRHIWNDAPDLPACEQKPLFDPNREGEKILHYLETLRPHLLLEQMVCTAFRASADTLNQTDFGGMKQMIVRMEQLYLTIASTLKTLRASHVADKEEELFSDLDRLCHIFEQVERLLIFAASIHRKLHAAPRLRNGIFDDCHKHFTPRMGVGSVDSNNKEFHIKQMVSRNERETVANLFPPPTANQSWRKVLSMGNQLNGHEPMKREIIFTVFDAMIGSHYGTSNQSDQEIETHRMYICGTSNDLQVALSVTSCD